MALGQLLKNGLESVIQCPYPLLLNILVPSFGSVLRLSDHRSQVGPPPLTVDLWTVQVFFRRRTCITPRHLSNCQVPDDTNSRFPVVKHEKLHSSSLTFSIRASVIPGGSFSFRFPPPPSIRGRSPSPFPRPPFSQSRGLITRLRPSI